MHVEVACVSVDEVLVVPGVFDAADDVVIAVTVDAVVAEVDAAIESEVKDVDDTDDADDAEVGGKDAMGADAGEDAKDNEEPKDTEDPKDNEVEVKVKVEVKVEVEIAKDIELEEGEDAEGIVSKTAISMMETVILKIRGGTLGSRAFTEK